VISSSFLLRKIKMTQRRKRKNTTVSNRLKQLATRNKELQAALHKNKKRRRSRTPMSDICMSQPVIGNEGSD
jgi:hypothetical protein